MKHVRFALLALALTLTAAACGSDLTGPSASVPSQNVDGQGTFGPDI